MSNLYDTDIVAWAEDQASALRRRAANEIDWDNIAEEIESVGNEQRHAVESLLINIMQHRCHTGSTKSMSGGCRWNAGCDAARNCGPTSRPSCPNSTWMRSGRCIARWTVCPGRRCRPTVRSHSPG